MATVPAWFNVDWYLASKAGKDLPKDDGTQKTAEDVRAELAAAGYVEAEGIFRHYEEWGKGEGVEPFDPATFDEDAYLAAKAAHDAEVSGDPVKTVEALKAELAEAKMSAIDHFIAYAAIEGTPYVPGEGGSEGEGGEGEGEGSADTSELTGALQGVATAEAAKDEVLEAALENEGVAEVLVPAVPGEPTDEEISTAIADNYAAIAGELGAAAYIGDSNFEDRAADIQDRLIADEKEELAADVEDAAAAAPAKSESLISKVLSKQEAYNTALETQTEAAADFAGANTTFKELNTTKALSYDSTAAFGTANQYGFAANADNTVDLKVDTDGSGAFDVLATRSATGVWTLGAAAANYEGVQALVDAYNTNQRAVDAELSAWNALEKAVKQVYENEKSGFVADDVSAALGAQGTAVASIDFTAEAKMHDAEDTVPNSTDSIQKVVLDFGGTWTTSDTITITVNGLSQKVTLAGTDGAAAATAVKSATFDGWSWTGSDSQAILTADAAAANVDVSWTPTTTQGTITLNEASSVDGAVAGDYASTGNYAADLSADLYDAMGAESAFAELVTEFEAARKLNGDLEAANKSLEDAADVVAGLGFNLVQADDANVYAFTTDDDVAVAVADATFEDFGADGVDRLFIGSEYKIVELTASDDVEKAVGDSAVLEFFVQQQGNDLMVYVENEAFSGSAMGAEDNLIAITLENVQLAGVNFGADGYLTAGEASA